MQYLLSALVFESVVLGDTSDLLEPRGFVINVVGMRPNMQGLKANRFYLFFLRLVTEDGSKNFLLVPKPASSSPDFDIMLLLNTLSSN